MKKYTTGTAHSELMSALVDGQLAMEDCAQLLSVLKDDELLIKKWSSYHLIGDALRASEPIGKGTDMAFVERIRQRLSLEAVPEHLRQTPAVQATGVLVQLPVTGSAVLPHSLQSANDGSFRWKAVAGLASLAAIGAIGWNLFGAAYGTDLPQLALSRDGSNEQVIVSSPQGPIVRDVRLEEFLAAHRQLGSTSALQMPSAFLRNAAFDAPRSDGTK